MFMQTPQDIPRLTLCKFYTRDKLRNQHWTLKLSAPNFDMMSCSYIMYEALHFHIFASHFLKLTIIILNEFHIIKLYFSTRINHSFTTHEVPVIAWFMIGGLGNSLITLSNLTLSWASVAYRKRERGVKLFDDVWTIPKFTRPSWISMIFNRLASMGRVSWRFLQSHPRVEGHKKAIT